MVVISAVPSSHRRSAGSQPKHRRPFSAPSSGATPSPGAVASAVACPDRRLGVPTADVRAAPSTSATARSRTIRATDHRLLQMDPADGAGGWLLGLGAL